MSIIAAWFRSCWTITGAIASALLMGSTGGTCDDLTSLEILELSTDASFKAYSGAGAFFSSFEPNGLMFSWASELDETLFCLMSRFF